MIEPSERPRPPAAAASQVGLDSHASVRLNFGQSPFAFDLAQLPPSLQQPQPERALSLQLLAMRLLPAIASLATSSGWSSSCPSAR